MKGKLLLATAISILLAISFSSNAQYYYYNNSYYDKDVIWEVGLSAGAMNGLTDVGGKKGSKLFPAGQVDLKSTQFNAGFYVSAIYQNLVGIRLEATWGKIAGADSNGAYPKRNLSFRTTINEIAGIAEFHPLALKQRDAAPLFSPYYAGGIGWFSFNPQAKLNGRWIDLQPLRTEGQGFPETVGYMRDEYSRPYKLSGINLITGFGVRFEPSRLISFRGEFLYRYTFTDYLDDASKNYVDPAWFDNNLSPTNAALAKQLFDRAGEKGEPSTYTVGSARGAWHTKDSYFTFNLKIGINLGRQRI